tara:strand:+ start:590 stop:2320 length:1731 start_codon:yes stop_codon:yes gene_type:complete
MRLLGLNATSHDSSAAIVIDGSVIAAVSEERVSRKKHDRGFPINSINAVLKSSSLKITDINAIGLSFDINYHIYNFFYNNIHPIAKDNEQKQRIKSLLGLKEKIRETLDFNGPILEHKHHLCHLRAAQFQSGFQKSLLCSFDGIGEIFTSSHAIYENNLILGYQENDRFPHSLGLVYAAITDYLGWQYNCDEGIVMGLASYGNPKETISNSKKNYLDLFREIIRLDRNMQVNLDLDYFGFHERRSNWVSEKFRIIFGEKRIPNSEISIIHKNIAAGLQKRIEEIIEIKVNNLSKKYPEINSICLSGGVALNCSNNGRIRTINKQFKNVFIQPASSDDGTSIGAALLTQDNLLGENINTIKTHEPKAYLGPIYNEVEIIKALENIIKEPKPTNNLYEKTAQLIYENKIVAWYQGRSEFGPRALGNRSILARPFPASNKDYINEKIKFREYFRPFAPVVIENLASNYFEIDSPSPHMMYAIKATKLGQEKCPATVHIDNTARVQTINKNQNNKLYKLINAFNIIAKVPILLNTSFNIKGQPIVEKPEEAIETFKNTAIDCLVIEDYLLIKEGDTIKML